MPTRGDVRFAALLVERGDQLGVDRRVGVGVVDDAGRRVALDVVDVDLVERPGVDQTFGAVLLVVDRTAVEAERLGQAVVVACRQPRLLGGFQRLVRRVGEERVDRRVQLGRRLERCLVGGVHPGGVVVDDRLGVVVARAGRAPPAGDGDRGEPTARAAISNARAIDRNGRVGRVTLHGAA